MLYNEQGIPATDSEVYSEVGRRRVAKRPTRMGARSMFTPEQKAEIRRVVALPAAEGGKTQVEIARELGCSQALISKVVKGER